jgi:hypothetical protein
MAAPNDAIPRMTLTFCPSRMTGAPGASSQPAKRLPIITASAPAANALTRSPEVLMPPSAITGVVSPASCNPRTASMIAVNCGTPKPVTMRVVQIEPGPMPTLIASAPAAARSRAPAAVATLPATICACEKSRRSQPHHLDAVVGVTVRNVEHEHIRAGLQQRRCAFDLVRPDADSRADQQPSARHRRWLRCDARRAPHRAR